MFSESKQFDAMALTLLQLQIRVECKDAGGALLKGHSFTVVVHIAMAKRPACREDAVTMHPSKQNHKERVGESKERQFVIIKRHASAEAANAPYMGVGMLAVTKRVAELQVDCLKNNGLCSDPAAASVAWCTANVAHVHQVSLFYF